ncbi:hypothetical protein [Roseivirga pacifica]|uniref:hypothetical protein n=1 Tax=Roseivirga pacifica TaxID=1267423 RepID=UPI003BB141A0
METLASIYTKGTKRKLQKFLGIESKDPWMKYKEIDFFKELFANCQPKKCLEYGCGTSTPYYMSHLPEGAEWVSIEHHKGWFDKISKVIDRPNLSLHFVDVEHNDPQTPADDVYAAFPQQFAPFDFILIDGIRRENCIELAHGMLAKNGVVVIHDSNRKQYHDHIKQFKYWFILEDFRKTAGGLGLASNDVDVTKLVKLEQHAALWKKDSAVSNFFKFKFLLGKKAKPFRLQTSN